MQPLEYELPQDRIAQFPLSNRAESKLLVYKDKQITESVFNNVAEFIPENAVLIRNISKVIPARILVPNGEVFLVEPVGYQCEQVMNKAGEIPWLCIVKNPKKIKGKHVLGRGITLEIIQNTNKDHIAVFHLTENVTMRDALDNIGKVPLPNYLERENQESDKENYQTLYASFDGSVAVPAAGLHFTDAIFDQLQSKGVTIIDIILHVGLGTFKPIYTDIDNHSMHGEFFQISADSLHQIGSALIEKKPIICIGTTTFRVMESISWMDSWYKPENPIQKVHQWIWKEKQFCGKDELSVLLSNMNKTLFGYTSIFCTRDYSPQLVDALFTNFHQPKSTLLELVSACIKKGWISVYQYALSHNFRFLSYGDGSLLWVSRNK